MPSFRACFIFFVLIISFSPESSSERASNESSPPWHHHHPPPAATPRPDDPPPGPTPRTQERSARLPFVHDPFFVLIDLVLTRIVSGSPQQHSLHFENPYPPPPPSALPPSPPSHCVGTPPPPPPAPSPSASARLRPGILASLTPAPCSIPCLRATRSPSPLSLALPTLDDNATTTTTTITTTTTRQQQRQQRDNNSATRRNNNGASPDRSLRVLACMRSLFVAHLGCKCECCHAGQDGEIWLDYVQQAPCT